MIVYYVLIVILALPVATVATLTLIEKRRAPAIEDLETQAAEREAQSQDEGGAQEI